MSLLQLTKSIVIVVQKGNVTVEVDSRWEKNCEVALVIRLHDSKKTFKAGIISGLRLFQSARERNSLT